MSLVWHYAISDNNNVDLYPDIGVNDEAARMIYTKYIHICIDFKSNVLLLDKFSNSY